MSEHIVTLRDDEGRGDLDATAFAGGTRRGPMVQLTITDHEGAKFVALLYSDVERLHAMLGSWLLDKLVTGRVTSAQRWGR